MSNEPTTTVPAGKSRWLVLAVIALSFLPVTIDSTVLYLAIPALTRDLGASGTEILWIMDIYPLTMAGLVLMAGPLGDRFGQRNLLLTGLGIFGLASGFAAFAPSPALLIACRVGLALGGCMIIPSSLALVRRIFTDPRERGIAIGVWGAVASAGSALGPVIGGVLLEHFWWGSVFLVNLPLAFIGIAIISHRLGNEPQPTMAPIEPLTALAGIIGLVGLVYAVKAVAHGDGASPGVLAGGLGGLFLLGLFARRQWRAPVPMLDLRLFLNPRFSLGVLTAAGPILVLVGFVLVFMQHLQFVQARSPLAAGLVIVPLDVAAALAAPLAGYLLPRFGLRGLGLLALATAMAGYGLLLGAGPAGATLGAMVLLGLGHGAAMALATASIMAAAPAEKAGAAASIESVAYEIGTGLGIALFGSLIGIVYTLGHTGAGESIGATLAAAAALGGEAGDALAAAGRAAFDQGFRVVLGAALGVLALIALALFRLLPAEKTQVQAKPTLGKAGG
ncbi:MFS transporter [Zavarzinia compransoris]|uniref:MFS transporter n=1 Tax=Zavarzinia compransoris TaxID=1264899 RepID=A0A317E316_9PROT|nr:MFS transporter [Zavarzinia compransoris]PWR19773.1 MFS transporter [Zavarzinia compransoris]TDP45124.1 DHA2 family multidrug resistance protein-like MFS transporter [Zavarzinia compransoris]